MIDVTQPEPDINELTEGHTFARHFQTVRDSLNALQIPITPTERTLSVKGTADFSDKANSVVCHITISLIYTDKERTIRYTCMQEVKPRRKLAETPPPTTSVYKMVIGKTNFDIFFKSPESPIGAQEIQLSWSENGAPRITPADEKASKEFEKALDDMVVSLAKFRKNPA